jgi:aspartate kinase
MLAQPERSLIMKFGGTSVGDSDAIRQVTKIVLQTRENWTRMIIVASAMSGVTNLLLKSAEHAIAGQTQLIHLSANKLREQHFAVADALITDLARNAQVKQEIGHLITDLTQLCQAISVLGESTPRALDAVASLGERMSVRLLAAILDVAGIPCQLVEANQLIVTDQQFQAAHPNFELTRQQGLAILEPILKAGKIPVVTGFMAATPEGVITTLGRGGSDYSAAIIGAILPADDVWIWTDVDGVMTADPRLVPEARTIPVLSYREIAELAYYGAKVVHPKTIRPVIEAGIGLRVCNTFNPEAAGTRIVPERSSQGNGAIKAVTAIRGQSLVTIEGRGMLGVPGVAARTFSAVAATGTSVPFITQASSEQSICFAVPSSEVRSVVASLEKAFASELTGGDIDQVWASPEVTIITVVGSGMRNTPGIAGKIFGALGEKKVNVIAIAQGSSEVSISLVVDAGDSETGVRAIHSLITE